MTIVPSNKRRSNHYIILKNWVHYQNATDDGENNLFYCGLGFSPLGSYWCFLTVASHNTVFTSHCFLFFPQLRALAQLADQSTSSRAFHHRLATLWSDSHARKNSRYGLDGPAGKSLASQ